MRSVCAAGKSRTSRVFVHYWRVKYATPAHSYVENQQTDRVDVVPTYTEYTHT